jgi:hypothetical protein
LIFQGKICSWLESHVLLTCPKYNILRQKYGIDNENNEDSLSFIINLMDEHLFSVLLIVFGVLFEYEILNILVVQTFCIFYYRKEVSPRILLL